MRYFTIEKIKKWCGQKKMTPLIDALNSSDVEVRKAAILCLGEIGDAVANDPLNHILENDPDLFVRNTAKRALENIQRVGIDSRINLNPKQVEPIYKLNIS